MDSGSAETSSMNLRGATITKNKNTFAKLQRERQKKRKAEEKRQRKLERKAAGPDFEADQTETYIEEEQEEVVGTEEVGTEE